ncbi:MAG: radical SAM protein [Thermoanaerobacteraceae bacterium]|nr:radical SAM protein [Thermoanaerobacteraceae bacterium]
MKYKHYTIPIFVPQEGCPFKCIYCNQFTITGGIETVNAMYVEETIEEHLKTIPENSYIEVGFFGGSFTGIQLSRQNELLSVAKRYKERGAIKGIRLSTRPDYINEKILQNLLEYGVTAIELGLQSMDESVLEASYRGHTPDDTRRAANLIKKYSFDLGLQMMIGLPNDDYYKDIRTAREIISMKADFVRLYPTLVIKNTYLEKLFKEGIYKPLTVEETIKICKDIMLLFTLADIPIIRLGLQTSDSINDNSDVIAGPFAPNIGEMVESALIRDMVLYYLRGRVNNDIIELTVNPLMMSKLVGYKRRNIELFKKELDCEVIIIQDEKLEKDMVKIEYNDNSMEINKKKYAMDAIKEGIIELT